MNSIFRLLGLAALIAFAIVAFHVIVPVLLVLVALAFVSRFVFGWQRHGTWGGAGCGHFRSADLYDSQSRYGIPTVDGSPWKRPSREQL